MIDSHEAGVTSGFLVAFNEVCRDDYYRLRDIQFAPDVILDIGANVGAFTNFARFLFPTAKIVAVEPDPVNYNYLCDFTRHLPAVTRINKALGVSEIWEGLCEPSPPYYSCLQSYITIDQIGFPKSDASQPPGLDGRDNLAVYKRSSVQPVTLAELIDEHVLSTDNLLVKLDCEGGENCIFDHEPSMAALRRVDVLTMETHFYTKGTGTEHEKNANTIISQLMSLSSTHECQHDENARRFIANRRKSNG